MTYFLGLTGSIATGKSEVSAYFKSLHIPVIDSDEIAHQIMDQDLSVQQQLMDTFGTSVVSNHQVDRKRLGKLVFGQPAQLAKLNQITSPVIRMEIKSQMANLNGEDSLVVVDIPLLFEANYVTEMNGVMVVATTPDIQLERLMARDDIDELGAKRKINSQISIETKMAQADFVIDNNQSIEKTRQQIDTFLKHHHR